MQRGGGARTVEMAPEKVIFLGRHRRADDDGGGGGGSGAAL